jgi:NADH-dependant formate dehydrogenase delta subunit FdsD
MNPVENLIMMANQIARNLAREPDPAAASAEHTGIRASRRLSCQLEHRAFNLQHTHHV